MAQALVDRVKAIEKAAAEVAANTEPIPGFLSLPSLRPYEVPATLQATVDRLNLQPNIDELKEKGYTVLRDLAPMADVEELCQTILARDPKGNGITKETVDLFGQEPCFDAVLLNEKTATMAEIMCGQGCLLSQMVATCNKQVKPNTRSYSLHADQNPWPAPFPEHNQFFTVCWALQDEDFTKENGATIVVPYSHKLRRHPTPAELAMQTDLAVAVECKRGDAVCWDGSIWHSFGLRTNPGTRVVTHTTFTRITNQELYAYGRHENVEKVLARHSGEQLERLKSMLGLQLANTAFRKNPTSEARTFGNSGPAKSFAELSTKSRGQFGNPAATGGAKSGKSMNKILDELKEGILAKL